MAFHINEARHTGQGVKRASETGSLLCGENVSENSKSRAENKPGYRPYDHRRTAITLLRSAGDVGNGSDRQALMIEAAIHLSMARNTMGGSAHA